MKGRSEREKRTLLESGNGDCRNFIGEELTISDDEGSDIEVSGDDLDYEFHVTSNEPSEEGEKGQSTTREILIERKEIRNEFSENLRMKSPVSQTVVYLHTQIKSCKQV